MKNTTRCKRGKFREGRYILGTYSTKFDSSVSGRSHNVALAAKSTSDVLLMPGESFSYNKHTGSRTTSNGYKKHL